MSVCVSLDKWAVIFSYLDIKSSFLICQVCKFFNNVARSAIYIAIRYLDLTGKKKPFDCNWECWRQICKIVYSLKNMFECPFGSLTSIAIYATIPLNFSVFEQALELSVVNYDYLAKSIRRLVEFEDKAEAPLSVLWNIFSVCYMDILGIKHKEKKWNVEHKIWALRKPVGFDRSEANLFLERVYSKMKEMFTFRIERHSVWNELADIRTQTSKINFLLRAYKEEKFKNLRDQQNKTARDLYWKRQGFLATKKQKV